MTYKHGCTQVYITLRVSAVVLKLPVGQIETTLKATALQTLPSHEIVKASRSDRSLEETLALDLALEIQILTTDCLEAKTVVSAFYHEIVFSLSQDRHTILAYNVLRFLLGTL